MKTGIFAIATSPKLERIGAPLTFPANDDGTIPTIYVGRSFTESPKFRKAMEHHSREFRSLIDAGKLSDSEDMRIMVNVFADVNMDVDIVKPWENVRLPEGVCGIGKGDNGPDSDLAFTRDNIVALLDGIPEVFKIATTFCTVSDNYRAKELQDLAKN